MSYDTGRGLGRFAVEPHLARGEKRSEVRAVSMDRLLQHFTERRRVKCTFTLSGDVVGRSEQDQFRHSRPFRFSLLSSIAMTSCPSSSPSPSGTIAIAFDPAIAFKRCDPSRATSVT